MSNKQGSGEYGFSSTMGIFGNGVETFEGSGPSSNAASDELSEG